MNKIKKILTPEEELAKLEAQLAGTLKPVTLPMRFAQRLQSRIHFPDRAEIQLRFSDWRRLFVVFGGVMSGMLALITLARAFYYLVGRKA